MTKRQIYWLLQFGGWSVLILYDFVLYTLGYGFELSVFLLSLTNILLGISLTHIYRLVIRRWNWSQLPLHQLIGRGMASVLLLGMVMTVFNVPLDKEILASHLIDQPYVFWGYYASWCKNLMTWILAYSVYHYVEQNRLVELEKIMLKTSMREAEARVLRSQLNPHFTFNALNSIRALIFEDPQKAQKGVTRLSNILRNSLLADRKKTIELRDELKTVEDYLELEKIRYEERLDYHLDCDPSCAYWQVPPMMLQTLVENGVKHGISNVLGGGKLSVHCALSEGVLHVKICNTGTLSSLKSESGSGVGLQNTTERLSILYGTRAQFQIYQADPQTVCAELRIPPLSEGHERLTGAPYQHQTSKT